MIKYLIIIATAMTIASCDDIEIPDTSPGGGGFQSEILKAHNMYRAKHGVSPLRWSSTLATYAKNHANKCVWKHSYGPYGENLAMGTNMTGPYALKLWYNEIKYYDYSNPGFTKGVGHFTQVVWKSTTKVGCAIVDCGGQPGMYGPYVVCAYDPPGNVLGRFAENVLRVVR